MILDSSSSKYYQLYKLLFQIVFWSMWILFPAVKFYYNQGIPWNFIYSCILLIPLFYINSNFLIPKVFEIKGVASYILSLIFIVLIFYLISVYVEYAFHPSIIDNPAPPDHFGNNPHRRLSHLFRGSPGPFRFWIKPILRTALIVLISTLYGLIDYFVREEQKKKDEKKEKLESELSFLRSQVSPHFLLNTLNSVLYLVRTKSSKAEELVLKLSDIIKYMIYECNNNEVSLNSEVQYLKNYIELQTIRFGEDVNIIYQCTGNFSSYSIEPMLLVPYVENAFKHGTAAITNPEISVLIDIEDGILRMLVKNKYQSVIKTKGETGGIGLGNVKRRLELLYPNTHKLTEGVEKEWYAVDLELNLNNNE